jgi:cysteine synthase A
MNKTANNLAELIGDTPLVKVTSLSQLTGCDIYVKCEFLNPGGSVKDRAALQMVTDAIASGELKPGMTIVEGTAGNTGIGLAIVAKSLGYDLEVVMPKGQTKEKEQMIELHGAKLHLVDAVPFSNPAHFYHTARTMAENNPKYWWANQFENLSNAKAHFEQTGPEIYQQTDKEIDVFVSVAGTGGTLGGISDYLKSQNPEIKTVAVDPDGSGILNYLAQGKHIATEGGSFTEGIGIMRLVENFKQAKIDYAVNLPDKDIVTIANYVRKHDALVLGSSSALNVTAAFFSALKFGPLGSNEKHSGQNHTIVTIACDLGERSISKLYNNEFLVSKNIDVAEQNIEQLKQKYLANTESLKKVDFSA